MGACSAYTSHNPNVPDALTPTVALSVGGDFLGEITNFPLPGGDNKNLGAWLKISSFIFFFSDLIPINLKTFPSCEGVQVWQKIK